MRSVNSGSKSSLSVVVFWSGVLLFLLGTIGILLDGVPESPVSGPGLEVDLDLELLGIIAGAGSFVGSQLLSISPARDSISSLKREEHSVYITRSLLETLLQLAARREPMSLSIGLAVTPAEQLEGANELPQSSLVFTHLYLPERPNSVSAVFGIDLQTPPRRIHGRFVTHPLSELRLTKRDDLQEVVFVAVPPWDGDSVAAFDRAGCRCAIQVIDAVPPNERVPATNP